MKALTRAARVAVLAAAFLALTAWLTGAATAQGNAGPTPDGRLRQVVTFTVHLRNEQGL